VRDSRRSEHGTQAFPARPAVSHPGCIASEPATATGSGTGAEFARRPATGVDETPGATRSQPSTTQSTQLATAITSTSSTAPARPTKPAVLVLPGAQPAVTLRQHPTPSYGFERVAPGLCLLNCSSPSMRVGPFRTVVMLKPVRSGPTCDSAACRTCLSKFETSRSELCSQLFVEGSRSLG
jgi:hypothetical protein